MIWQKRSKNYPRSQILLTPFWVKFIRNGLKNLDSTSSDTRTSVIWDIFFDISDSSVIVNLKLR